MDKQKVLAEYLLKQKGILNPADQEAEIAKMAAACPAATAAEKGLTTDLDKAYETYLIETGAQNPTAIAPKSTSQPAVGVSSAEALQIQKTLMAQNTQRQAVSQNTSIDAYVFDRPAPQDIIPAGTKGAIVEKSWNTLMAKIDSGEYIVCENDGEEVDADKRIASKSNFEALKAAQAAGQLVDVYVGKMSTAPIGYIVNVANQTGANVTKKQMKREDLKNFLILETAGYILSSDTKPGAKLRYTESSTSNTVAGKVTGGKTVLADANKKAAVEAGSYEVSRSVDSEAVETTLKSALNFRVQVVKNGKVEMKGDGVTPKTRTIRVSVTASVPGTTRKPEFVDTFGTGIRESNTDLSAVPEGKQLDKINEAQRNAIAALRAKANSVTEMSEVAHLSDKLAAFDAPKAQAPGSVL